MTNRLLVIAAAVLVCAGPAAAVCPSGKTVQVGPSGDVQTISEALDCLDGLGTPMSRGLIEVASGTYDGFWMLKGTVDGITRDHDYITVTAGPGATVTIVPRDDHEIAGSWGDRLVGVWLRGELRKVELIGLDIVSSQNAIQIDPDDAGTGLRNLLVDSCDLIATADEPGGIDIVLARGDDTHTSEVTVTNSTGETTFDGLTVGDGNVRFVSRGNQWRIRDLGQFHPRAMYRDFSGADQSVFFVDGDVVTSDVLTTPQSASIVKLENKSSVTSEFRNLNAQLISGSTGGMHLRGVLKAVGPSEVLFYDSVIRLQPAAQDACTGIDLDSFMFGGGPFAPPPFMNRVVFIAGSLSCLGSSASFELESPSGGCGSIAVLTARNTCNDYCRIQLADTANNNGTCIDTPTQQNSIDLP